MKEINKQLEILKQEREKDLDSFKKNFLKILNDNSPDVLPNSNSIFRLKEVFKEDDIKILNTIFMINRFNFVYEKDRPHNVNRDVFINDIIENAGSKIGLDFKTFKDIIDTALYIELDDNLKEVETKNKHARNIYSLFSDTFLDKKEMIDLLISLRKDNATFNETVNIISKKRNINKDELIKSIEYIKYNFSSLGDDFYKDIVKTIMYKDRENDYVLEQNFVFNRFKNNVIFSKYNTINIVFEPSFFFIEKWINDNSLHGKETYFVFKDLAIKEILDSVFPQLSISGASVSFQYINKLEKINKLNNYDKNILFFSNHLMRNASEKVANLEKILSNSGDKFTVQIIDFDNDLFSSKSVFNNYIFNKKSFEIDKVYLLPDGIKGSSIPERKTLLIIKNSEKNNSSNINTAPVFRYSLITKHKKQRLYRIGFSFDIDCSINDSKPNIRSLFKHEYDKYMAKESKKGRSFEYKFSDEISLFVWHQNTESRDKVRLKCSIIDPRYITNKKKKPTTIKGTEKSVRSLVVDKIETWLENDYPFASIEDKKTKERKSVRERAKDILNEYYKERPISLKTMIFLYPEIDVILSQYDDIYSELKGTDLFSIRIDFLEKQYIKETINSLFDEFNSADKHIKSQEFIFKLLEIAVKNKHISNNVYASEYQLEKSDKKAFRQVSDAILKRYLTTDESRKVLKYILGKIHKEDKNDAYYGTLIKLLTGLDTVIVSALKWKDFVTSKVDKNDYIYQLVIRRRVDYGGKTYQKLSKREEYRIVPCCDLLAELLKEKLNFSMIRNGANKKEDLNELSIIEGGTIIGSSNFIIAPDALNKIARDVLEKSCNYLEDKYIHTKKGRKKVNFSRYNGDLYRSNYRHQAISNCGFTEGEVDYLLGNKPSTTFSLNYCDYTNDCSQVLLKLKQNRISNIFKKPQKHTNKMSLELDVINYKSNANYTDFNCLELELVANSNTSVDLEIENEYGFDFELTEYDYENI